MTSLPPSGDAAFDAAVAEELAREAGGEVLFARRDARKIRATLLRPALVALPFTVLLALLSVGMFRHSRAGGILAAAAAAGFFLALQLPYWIQAARWARRPAFYLATRDAVLVCFEGTFRIPYGYLAAVSAPPPGHGPPPANRSIVLSLRNGAAVSLPNIFTPPPDEAYRHLLRRLADAAPALPAPTGGEVWETCNCARMPVAPRAGASIGSEGFEVAAHDGPFRFFRCRRCRTPYVEYPAQHRRGEVGLRQSVTDPEFLLFLEEPARARADLAASLDALMTDQRLEVQRGRAYVRVTGRAQAAVPQWVPLSEYERYW